LVVFLIAPQDLLAANPAIAPLLHSQQFFYNNNTEHSGDSLLLFPGVSGLIGVDVAYIFALGVSAVVGLIVACLFAIRHRWYLVSCRNYGRTALFMALALLAELLLHLFGNVHYQVYCGVGVIPRENCMFLCNWASFLASVAGFLIIGVPIALLVGFVLLAKWLFIKEQITPILQPVP
jgi:hypothetical protein